MKTLLIALTPIILLAAAFFGYNLYKTTQVTTNASITISQAYAFSTLPGATTGAAFMTIKNKTAEDDKLISASTSLATINELHQNIIDPDDGTMMMRKVDGVDLPASGQALLEPKSYHVMFIDLKKPLTMDSTFPLTLEFEKGGKVVTNVKVIQPGTKPSE